MTPSQLKRMTWVGARCTMDGDCWIWNQAVQSTGYPQARLDGTTKDVRHAVYKILGKKIRSGNRLTSLCGNRRCVSPDCLQAESITTILKRCYEDGTRDRISESIKGRQSFERRNLPTKLTMEKARAIRSRPESHTELAREYGVHIETISRIRRGVLWREAANGARVFTWRGVA